MPSKAYFKALDQMREHHVTRKTYSGNGCIKHREALVAFSKEIGAASALDYGCGKGHQYCPGMQKDGYDLVADLGYTPFAYDPAVPEFNVLPEIGTKFDLVFCVDVLECVPQKDVPWALEHLASFATKGIFITVSSYPSKKTLPNGSNAHITVQPIEWWQEKFDALGAANPDLKIMALVG
jgi:hypothetical protein